MPVKEKLERDPARIDRLQATIERLLPALEAFTRFEGPDPGVRRSAWRARLDEPLPERGAGPDAVLELLETVVIPNGLRIGHPGFTGWVTTMPTTVATAAQLAGSVAAAQRWWASPGNFIEVLALRWLAQLVGLPDHFQGAFVSGGSLANLLGLAAARQWAGEQRGLDVAADGLGALAEPRVYTSTEVHHVALRAMGVLGMGRRALRLVPVDAQRRPDLDRMRREIDDDTAAGRTPVAVIASAGDVNTGVVDPIDAMRELAHERGVWLHVDGAYGGFGLLDPRVRPLFGDISRIDSFAIDPHKWLAVPVGCGAGYVRDGELLARTFALEPADYVAHEPTSHGDTGSVFEELGEGSPDYSVDHSAPSRGLAVWAVLKEIGKDGMRRRIVRDNDCARRVAERVRTSERLELLSEPVLSICCFRYRPARVTDETALDTFNEELLWRVRNRGRVTPSSTRVGGRFALRPCFVNPRSTLTDADAVVDEVLAAGAELEREA